MNSAWRRRLTLVAMCIAQGMILLDITLPSGRVNGQLLSRPFPMAMPWQFWSPDFASSARRSSRHSGSATTSSDLYHRETLVPRHRAGSGRCRTGDLLTLGLALSSLDSNPHGARPGPPRRVWRLLCLRTAS